MFNFQPNTLMDIGCGTGHITYSLKKIFKLKKKLWELILQNMQ